MKPNHWLVAALLATFLSSPALAHMDDRKDLNNWFDGLSSGNGPCCSFSEGTVVKDADWTIKGEGQQCELAINDAANHYKGTYCVYLDDKWYLVPDTAVITVPNRYGPALVWPVYSASAGAARELVTIRCFIKGAET